MTEPFFRVVKGNPTEAELAALTVVLVGLGTTCQPNQVLDQTSWWANKGKLLGVPPATTQNAWRTSMLP